MGKLKICTKFCFEFLCKETCSHSRRDSTKMGLKIGCDDVVWFTAMLNSL
jgi:hypothetical protein